MKCPKCRADVLQQFKFCHVCGATLPSVNAPSEKEPKKPLSFEEFRRDIASRKNEKSTNHSSGPAAKKKKCEPPKEVLVNVGVMKLAKGELKPNKGKGMLVRVPVNIRKADLLQKSIEKHAAHDRNFDRSENYAILYTDGTEVLTLPGDHTQLFQLDKYKEDVAKPYNRITFYLVERSILEQIKGDSSDSSDFEGMTRSAFMIDDYTPQKVEESSSNTRDVVVIQDNNKEDVKSTTTSSTSMQHSLMQTTIPAMCKRRDHNFQQLKDMFPAKEEGELTAALDSTASLEEAINILLNSSTPSLNHAYASLFTDDSWADDDINDVDLLNMYASDVADLEEASTFVSDSKLQEKLSEHKKVELGNAGFLRIKVRRQAVWEDTQFKFSRIQHDDVKKPIKVHFIGEPAVDSGGPSREFFSLINASANSKLMSGGVFRHNVTSLDKKEFYLYGQMTALGLMQGFPGPKCFNQTVVDYILTGNIDNLHPDVEDIPNSNVKQSLETLMSMTDEAEFKTQATFNSDFRFDAGYNKPFVCMEDKDELCRSVALHHVILASITETNQYIEGLKITNMLDLIRDNPELFRKVFQVQKELSAELVDDIFEVEYSPVESNKFATEQKIVFNLTQYLEDVEKGMITTNVEGKQVVVTLKHVLQFITGAEDIPAIGFTPRPTIKFCHETNPLLIRKLTANTCANILTLPVFGMSEYAKFSEEVTFCLMNSPGFGSI